MGCGVMEENRALTGAPSSLSTMANASPLSNGGTRSCSCASAEA